MFKIENVEIETIITYRVEFFKIKSFYFNFTI